MALQAPRRQAVETARLGSNTGASSFFLRLSPLYVLWAAMARVFVARGGDPEVGLSPANCARSR